jgi:hypothetical protein
MHRLVSAQNRRHPAAAMFLHRVIQVQNKQHPAPVMQRRRLFLA